VSRHTDKEKLKRRRLLYELALLLYNWDYIPVQSIPKLLVLNLKEKLNLLKTIIFGL
jgi:hypothetical protein